MLILTAGIGTAHDARVVLIFGHGLIGQAIDRALCAQCEFRQQVQAFDWTDADARRHQTENIVRFIVSALSASSKDQPCSLDVLWSAGKGGFATSAEVFDGEFAAFCDVLSLLEKISDQLPQASLAFHLISSAGGLFEGVTFVDRNTAPEPKRAYGLNKLRQEQQLEKLPSRIRRFCYRPSTVYGHLPGGRMGLVTTILANSLSQQVTSIFGSSTTVRDFIFADDIGRYVAGQILHRNDGGEDEMIRFMVSGKPTIVRPISIFRIKSPMAGPPS